MVQKKKPELREAIVASAFDLISRKGYTATTVAEIARAASMTAANVYVYYPSKILILYAIYEPWLVRQLEQLREAATKFRTPRMRLRRVFIGLWGDIPAADHNFANTLIEALASAPEATGKPNQLLVWCEDYVTDLIREILPEERRRILENRLLAHVVWMAFDGFCVNRRIGDVRDIEAIADLLTDLLLGEVGKSAGRCAEHASIRP
jgi:AcrR family transcriptional regulator